MNEPTKEGGARWKEVSTGIPGHTCRYSGDAQTGLTLDIAPNDVLAVSPEQIRAMFAALGSRNMLLEDCSGFRPKVSPTQIMQWLVRPGRRTRPVRQGFADWLYENSPAVFGRPLGDEHAVRIQAALAGEGLLALSCDSPAAFPHLDMPTALQALVGQRVIHEDSRRFVAAELCRVFTTGNGPDAQVYLSMENLFLPGFQADYPRDFTAGGLIEATHMRPGMVSGYMGMWATVTSPRTVDRIIEFAATCHSRNALLTECRRQVFGYGRWKWSAY